MIIYGTDLCKDCVQCKQDLDASGVSYEYRDISSNLLHLKEFLSIRDKEAVFADAKAQGYIGIPTIVTADGKILLDWDEMIQKG